MKKVKLIYGYQDDFEKNYADFLNDKTKKIITVSQPFSTTTVGKEIMIVIVYKDAINAIKNK